MTLSSDLEKGGFVRGPWVEGYELKSSWQRWSRRRLAPYCPPVWSAMSSASGTPQWLPRIGSRLALAK